jgi:hypothetical protein
MQMQWMFQVVVLALRVGEKLFHEIDKKKETNKLKKERESI